jgi:hypothetical protein
MQRVGDGLASQLLNLVDAFAPLFIARGKGSADGSAHEFAFVLGAIAIEANRHGGIVGHCHVVIS